METGNIIALIAMGLGLIGGYVKVMGQLESQKVKVDLLWDSFKEMAKDAAKILHTPHPGEERKDYLLERFVEGTIVSGELRELILKLKAIMDNKSKEFGERTAASQLLRAIELQYKI